MICKSATVSICLENQDEKGKNSIGKKENKMNE